MEPVPTADYPTAHYLRHLHSRRMNEPGSYVTYLKRQPRFRGGALDRIPRLGVILHDTRVLDHLAALGVPGSHVAEIHTGTTDPNLIVVVYADDGESLLVINRGLPGGGGISTQAAELGALGVRDLVHVGTCALMGSDVDSGRVIVSRGSYKDGTAFLLSDPVGGGVAPSSYPETEFSGDLAAALTGAGASVARAQGYTIPTFYFQPESLVRSLVLNRDLPGEEAVGYIEMEEAPFFEVATRMGLRAASVVLGSDRYTIEDGELVHRYEEDFDQDAAERLVLRVVIERAAAERGLELSWASGGRPDVTGTTGLAL